MLVAEITSLGREGHALRAIERATGIRRERVSALLKHVGVAVGKARPTTTATAHVATAATTTATAPIVATTVAVTANSDTRGDPDERGHRAIAEAPFSWSVFAVGHRQRAVELPDVATKWSYPLTLRALHVRALREGVAAHHRLQEAASRIGIDRWVGRPVRDLTDVATVVAEIHDALTAQQRRMRG